MPDSNVPSSFRFWLEEALLGWMLPVAAVALMVLAGVLYWLGTLSEETMAALIIVGAPLVGAIFMARPALDPARSSQGRALIWIATAATLAMAVVPAFRAVFPGTPLFTGDAGLEGDSIAVPPGVSGRVRLLVNGKLGQGGESTVRFTLTGTTEPVEGTIERTFTMARVGKSGRARVAHDHTSDYYQASLPAGMQALKLDHVAGQLGGRLEVAAYRVLFRPAELVWLAVLVLLLAAAADARAGIQGNLAITAGMILAFGSIVLIQATPHSAVGVSFGGLVLGAIVGAFAGSLAAWIVRKFVPAEPRRKGSAKAAKPGRDDKEGKDAALA